MLSRLTKRTDLDNGVREEECFLPVHGGELFCAFHRPVGLPRATVIICGALYAERMKLNRTEVLTARTLAAAGHLVGRFHYRGTGQSAGLGQASTLATMLEDARTETAFLHRERTPLLFVGGRWGALVAGLAAAEWTGAALALWEPVIEANRFFQEMFRPRQLTALAAGGGSHGAQDVAREMRREGHIDTLGDAIDRPLYESAQGVSLMGVPAAGPRPVLLIQIGRGDALRPEAAALRDAFTAAGSSVSTTLITGEEAWSAIDAPLRGNETLIETTRLFLEARLSRAVAWPRRRDRVGATDPVSGMRTGTLRPPDGASGPTAQTSGAGSGGVHADTAQEAQTEERTHGQA